MKENSFTLKKARTRRYSARTITDADDKALQANTPTQVESQLHSLEQAACGIGLDVTADKTEYMCCNEKGHISTLNGDSLKLIDLIHLSGNGNSFSSTENDVNMRRVNSWTAIDRLSIIWKSNLSVIFSKRQSCPYYYIDAPDRRRLSRWKKKARRKLHTNTTSYTEQI